MGMKTTFRLSAFAVCLFFTPTSIFAQGEFLNRGESGWGASISSAFLQTSSAYSISFGYSFKGLFDIDLSAGRGYQGSPFNESDDYHVYDNFVSPSITIYLEKQDSRKKNLWLHFL
jgi:hypothetical protein